MFTTSLLLGENMLLFFRSNHKILLALCNLKFNDLVLTFTWQTRWLITPFYYVDNLFIRILLLPREVYCYFALVFCFINTLSAILLIQYVLADVDTRQPSSTAWWICIRQSDIFILHVAYPPVSSLNYITSRFWCYCCWSFN